MLLRSPSTPPPLDPVAAGWDWTAFSALSTLLAALATLAAVIISLVSFHHQRTREAELHAHELTRQRRDQAGYVSVWYDDAHEWIWIENRSEQPIYDAGAVLLLPDGPAADGRLHMPFAVAGGFLRFLAPRHRVSIEPQVEISDPVPVLAFRDSQGVIWQRDRLGNLTELEQDVLTHYGVEPGEFCPIGLPQSF